MDIQPLFLARAQFLAALSFQSFFLALTLALSWLLVLFKLQSRRSDNPGWIGAYRFWVRIFALSFVLALASSVPVFFQLGILWSGLMDKIGNVAGPLLGFAVLCIFVVKSCFLGVMLFGQRRVSPAVHDLVVVMVALGQMVAVFWLLVLQSWIETPTGARLFDGRYQVFDWHAVIFNPALNWRLAATGVGAALSAAFLVMGITAWQALRRRLDDGERLAFRTALVVAVIAVCLQFPVAVGTLRNMVAYQPAKAAAAAAYWHSGARPELVIFGWPDPQTESNGSSLVFTHAGGNFVTPDPHGGYQGLDQFSGMRPPVALTFWSLRVILLLGLAMGVVAWVTLLWVRKRNFDPGQLPRGWLRVVAGMMFAGGLAVVAATCFSLLGLQPYAVNGMITQGEVLGPASALSLLYGLVGFVALDVLLAGAFISMLFYAARYGVVPVRKVRGPI
jgi:cytochrome d ubiquinol oxidase subunit I